VLPLVVNTTARNISGSTDSSPPLKKCWCVGKHTVVILDKDIVERFGITEHNTYVEQKVTDDGILLRVKHYFKEREM
jgi:hypothetical protein